MVATHSKPVTHTLHGVSGGGIPHWYDFIPCGSTVRVVTRTPASLYYVRGKAILPDGTRVDGETVMGVERARTFWAERVKLGYRKV